MAEGRDYDALRAYLVASGTSVIAMTFPEIGKVIGGAGLPSSARNHDAWWANEDVKTTRHRHCLGWQAAGYDVDKVDRRAETVTFRRKV